MAAVVGSLVLQAQQMHFGSRAAVVLRQQAPRRWVGLQPLPNQPAKRRASSQTVFGALPEGSGLGPAYRRIAIYLIK